MRANYVGGNYGYGHAKKALLELILDRFAEQRERFDYYMEHRDELDAKLAEGAEKARVVASQTLKRMRDRLGYKA